MSERKKILVLGNRKLYHGLGRGFKYDMFLELLREELARQHDVLCWGWGYRYNWREDVQLSGVIDFFGKPDIVLTDSLYDFTHLGILDIDAVKVHIMGDFYYGMSERPFHKSLKAFKQYDILLAVSNSALLLAKEQFPDKECIFWPWSVDTNFFRNYDRDRPIDVFFAASVQEQLYGPDRKLIQQILMEMQLEGFNTWTGRKAYFGDYVDMMNASKVSVGNNSKFGFMTKKALEVMACGALLLTDKCEEFDMVGIEDGEHVVVYNDLDDLRDKIYYYLKNDSERELIAFNGYDLVINEFSTRDAVHKMMEIISNVNINA